MSPIVGCTPVPFLGFGIEIPHYNAESVNACELLVNAVYNPILLL